MLNFLYAYLKRVVNFQKITHRSTTTAQTRLTKDILCHI